MAISKEDYGINCRKYYNVLEVLINKRYNKNIKETKE